MFFRTEEMPAHATYPSLSHAWGEFVYSYSGITEVQIGNQHYLAPPHLGLWIPSGTEHTGFNHHAAVHSSIYISPRLCAHLPAQPGAIIVTPLLRAILDHLRSLPAGGDGEAPRQRLLRVLVDQLAECQSAGSYIPSTDEPVLASVLQALRDDPADDRSVAELARHFHLSERTLMRRCRQELGMSLMEWRQRMKTVKALELLQGGQSVESTALELGYATASAFIAMFRRLMGSSPGQYMADAGHRRPLVKVKSFCRRV